MNWNFTSSYASTCYTCCLSCRGVNWNTNWCNLFVNRFQLPLMQRRELKFYLSPDLSPREKCCLSCRGVNWNHSRGGYASKQVSCLSCRGVNWNPLGAWNLLCDRVASHVEAWIEISQAETFCSYSALPLMQRRELKYPMTKSKWNCLNVASRVEAWIEIPFARKVCIEIYVASRAEATIEMKVARNIN